MHKVPPPVAYPTWFRLVIDFLKEMFNAFISIWPWWVVYLVGLFVFSIIIYMLFKWVF